MFGVKRCLTLVGIVVWGDRVHARCVSRGAAVLRPGLDDYQRFRFPQDLLVHHEIERVFPDRNASPREPGPDAGVVPGRVELRCNLGRHRSRTIARKGGGEEDGSGMTQPISGPYVGYRSTAEIEPYAAKTSTCAACGV